MASFGHIYKIKIDNLDKIEKDGINRIFHWDEGFESNSEISLLATELVKKGEATAISRACYPSIWLVKAKDIFSAIQERIDHKIAVQLKVYGEIKHKLYQLDEAILESCKPDEWVYLEYWDGL